MAERSTGMSCPACHRPTIERVHGEWCPRCRSFVREVTMYYASDDRKNVVRTLARRPF